MKLDSLKGKKILILGFGIEGKATLQFLKRHFPKKTIGIVDKKDGPDYLKKQTDYDVVIKSPGIPPRLVTIPYTTATNIFFANVKGTTIGVTGSKGKSTTTSLIYAILKETGLRAHLVGNIGNPLLAELSKSNEQNDIYVCELSSFQISDIQYSPHISVIINLYPGHMDYHGSVDEYYRAKKRIIAKAKSNDYFVFNPAFGELKKLAKQARAKAIPFIDRLPFDTSIIPLLGKHNIDNVRAATTVAKVLNIEMKHIVNAVKNFKGLPHRLELVGTFKGITFYDDAIATIPEATIAAIETLGNIGTIFLGGSDRGYDYGSLVDTIISKKIPNLVLFPDTGQNILKALMAMTGSGPVRRYQPRLFQTRSMEEAVKFAYEKTPKGSICVLSSAAPSFSLWKNFEEKGDLFQKFIKKYGR